MEKSISRNIRLGIFVTIGTLILIYALYMIGSKKNFFGSTFRVNAMFHNVNGLMAGNNVRFAGIDVGTVESVQIINDSLIKVVMVIETKDEKFISKNAIASIGTDGLMGNKIVNINGGSTEATELKKDDTIATMRPIETDEMIRTLNRTNDNIAVITDNLKKITTKINSPNTMWSLLMDTVVADNIKEAVVNIRRTGKNSAEVTGDLSNIVKSIKDGKGSVGALLADTSISNEIHQAVVNIKITGSRAAIVTGDLDSILKKVNNDNGTMGRLFMDTTFVPNLNKSMENIKTGTKGLNEVIDALKHSVFLRGYFRRKEKHQVHITKADSSQNKTSH
jgi:phospholipid/cholesterol/gamma-HCH transport system substrate-binding protein